MIYVHGFLSISACTPITKCAGLIDSSKMADAKKSHPSDSHSLTDFKLLSFDCFGTLVDWESGIHAELGPLIGRLPSNYPLKSDRNGMIKEFNRHEVALCQSRPRMKYDELLMQAYFDLAASLSLPQPPETEAKSLGASVSRWPAFPDTVEALNRLKKYYKLVVLSNVDNQSFSNVLCGPLKDVKFDAVYTAEDIGSYKPDLYNFHYLLKRVKAELGAEKEQVLHTAHGLKSDHVPAKEMEMASAWIARGDGAGGPGAQSEMVQTDVTFTWHFDTMGEMANAADHAFTSK